MKKTILLTATLLLATMVSTAQTQLGTSDTYYQLTGSGSNLTLTISGTGDMPNSCGTYAPWHNSRGDITNIIIEDGVTSIGGEAFYNCTNLTSITIPEGVTDIGSYAFGYCTSLTAITIPSSVTSMTSGTFSECSALTVIYSLNPEPPVGYNMLTVADRQITIYVPMGSATLYRSTDLWNNWLFLIIEEQIEVAEAEESVVISWLPNENAEGYTLTIYRNEERTDIIGIYHFDNQGELLRSSEEPQMLRHTLQNLIPNTAYYYTLETLGADQTLLMRSSASFKTALAGTTNNDDITADKGTIVSEEYFSIDGKQLLAEPEQGLYIKRTVYENGKVETEKVWRK